MNKAGLLSTAAAALLISTGAASAQTQDKVSPEPAPAAQQNAPPAKIAPPMNAGDHKPVVKPEITGQAPKELAPGRGESARSSADIKGTAAAAGKAELKSAPDEKSAADANKADANKSTTGQGAASGSAKLSNEQRSKITSVIKKQNVKPVHLDISISVGTRVPSSVRYYPIPVEVVTIYPEWRGYDYILVGDRIVVIDPDTHEIVAIIEA